VFPDTVETLRLDLRRPVPTDAERIFRTYAQDREVTRYVEWVPHTSVETTKKFVAFCQDRWTNSVAFPYVITRKKTGSCLE
jgi:ribosomal-protein-alanine N-acetyltransferase